MIVLSIVEVGYAVYDLLKWSYSGSILQPFLIKTIWIIKSIGSQIGMDFVYR